jgi:HME family heavy-metal exporter
LNVDQVNEFIETAMNGRTVSEVVQGQRKFDLLVRLDADYRTHPEKLRRLSIHLPAGGRVPLETVAEISRGSGPNTINRENVRRRIIVQCNTAGRDLNGVVTDICSAGADSEVAADWLLHEYGGQFEASACHTNDWPPQPDSSQRCSSRPHCFARRTGAQVLAALPMAAIMPSRPWLSHANL